MLRPFIIPFGWFVDYNLPCFIPLHCKVYVLTGLCFNGSRGSIEHYYPTSLFISYFLMSIIRVSKKGIFSNRDVIVTDPLGNNNLIGRLAYWNAIT